MEHIWLAKKPQLSSTPHLSIHLKDKECIKFSSHLHYTMSDTGVQVWMDEWKDFYFSINPGARKADKGDLTK